MTRSATPPVLFPLAGKRIWVAGHRGMVGSALVRRLEREDCEVLTVARDRLDLRDRRDTVGWVWENRPDAVILAAAKVGGIHANDSYPADFLHDNLAIELAVIEAAYRAKVSKLLFLGSSCIYPKMAAQPITEDALMTGPLEPTNEAYAIAKIAGVKLCQAYRRQHGCDFISAMPTNLYGINDSFDERNGHVFAALISKIDRAKRLGEPTVTLWGSGQPRREFLYADDCADALVHLLAHYSDLPPVNVGTGQDLTIQSLAELIARVIGYEGAFVFDRSKPDGTPRKLLDVSVLAELGWTAPTSLEEGVRRTHDWFTANTRERPAAVPAL